MYPNHKPKDKITNNKKKTIYILRFFRFTVQKMLNFQNLQNLASIQQQKLSLVSLAAASCLNSPLNLSLGSTSTAAINTDPSQLNANCSAAIATELANSLCGTANETFSPQMPQLILASGQLMQGVQVAQLLIPSTQGKIDFFRICRLVCGAVRCGVWWTVDVAPVFDANQ